VFTVRQELIFLFRYISSGKRINAVRLSPSGSSEVFRKIVRAVRCSSNTNLLLKPHFTNVYRNCVERCRLYCGEGPHGRTSYDV
jgi:hypothetical protein